MNEEIESASEIPPFDDREDPYPSDGEREEEPVDEDAGMVGIGPSPELFIVLLMGCGISFWMGLLVLSGIAGIRLTVDLAVAYPWVTQWVDNGEIVAWCLLAFALVRSSITYMTAHYEMNDHKVLFLHGFLSPYAPSGSFLANYRDSHMHRTLNSANDVRTLIGLFCGSGTLVITLSNDKTIIVHGVVEPEKVRRTIERNSKLASSRRIAGT